MKILVTGANGFLGRGIVDCLLDLGHQVVATDYNVERVNENSVRIACDLFEIEKPYQFFNCPDCLLHLAWRDGFEHFSNAHIHDLPLHQCFIEKMVKSGVKSVVALGTMHEVGYYDGKIDEKTPCNPMNYYGIAKNALRKLTEIICDKNSIDYKWLRAYYIVSDSPVGTSIFSKITQAEMKGIRKFPFTSGMNQYDFLDYNGFCYRVALATVQSSINGIINICSGYPERLADRVERFIHENNFKIKLEYGAFPDRPYDSKAIWGNSKKIETILEMYHNGTD